jgi:glucose-6-phosphate isomerase
VNDPETLVARIWNRDVSVWMPAERQSDAAARAIANRLGWLDAPDTMRAHLPRVQALAEAARADGVRDVYLLGMGGSSLCAEVMRTAYPPSEGRPALHVLDTTDEHALTAVAARLDAPHSWFVVASKSGGTVEVASMERYFWSLMERTLEADAGRHFVAITDPGTVLESLAGARGYREVFLNPPDIGGRFSVLSLFGLVPAALIGIDVAHLLQTAAEMAAGCRETRETINPGLALGSFMARTCRDGRDKLTVLLPPSLRMLGLWIEQLVAESTGKHGTGVLPIVDEAPQAATAYGHDRAFVTLETEREPLDTDLSAISAGGHPVLRLSLRADALGAEFFRWEFATAVAGAMLGINPFDEPNVQEAKDRTRALLAQVAHGGALPDPEASATDAAPRLAGLLKTLGPPQYLGVLLYLPAEPATLEVVEQFRAVVRDRTAAATTVGVGPRYLHSTGQYHKGGPATGTFLVITGEDETATAVPEAPYSFSVLKRAQAIGDVQALQAHGRPVVRLHLRETRDRAAALQRILAAALAS